VRIQVENAVAGLLVQTGIGDAILAADETTGELRGVRRLDGGIATVAGYVPGSRVKPWQPGPLSPGELDRIVDSGPTDRVKSEGTHTAGPIEPDRLELVTGV
jgi:hypothetical protein